MDMMFKATNKETWDAWVSEAGLISPGKEEKGWGEIRIYIDEIGPIVTTPAEYDEDMNMITPPVFDNSHHVNVRIMDPGVQTYTDLEGNEHTHGVDYALLAEGGEGVEWIDPAIVTSPERIWAGGMTYWMPDNENL